MSSKKTNRIRILFMAEASTLAHVVRPLWLAQSLMATVDPDRFEMLFACDRHFDWVLHGSKIQRVPIHSRSPQEVLSIANRGGILFDRDILKDYVVADLKLISDLRPAVIVNDMRQSLAISAPLAGVPLITLTNAHWSKLADRRYFPHPPFPPLKMFAAVPTLSRAFSKILTRTFQFALPAVLTKQASGLNTLRKEYGLAEFPDYFSGFTFGDQILFCDTPLLAPTQELLGHERYIGVINWSPETILPEWWTKLPKQKPRAYVCLGSSGNFALTEKIVQALVACRITPIVAGSGFDKSKPWPGSFGADLLPGSKVCEAVDFVVSNGGSPSSYQALSAGKPVLGIPSNMDQILTMDRIAELRAGIMLRPEQVSVGALRHAITALLREDLYNANAKLIRNEISKYSPLTHFRSALESVLKQSLHSDNQAVVAR